MTYLLAPTADVNRLDLFRVRTLFNAVDDRPKESFEVFVDIMINISQDSLEEVDQGLNLLL